MQQKIRQIFFVSEIIVSDLVSLICLYCEQVIFHRQQMG